MVKTPCKCCGAVGLWLPSFYCSEECAAMKHAPKRPLVRWNDGYDDGCDDGMVEDDYAEDSMP